MLLFSTYRIKNLELQNRIVLPPLASFLIKQGGSITDQTIEHEFRKMLAARGITLEAESRDG